MGSEYTVSVWARVGLRDYYEYEIIFETDNLQEALDKMKSLERESKCIKLEWRPPCLE